jgi:hypothetical protein
MTSDSGCISRYTGPASLFSLNSHQLDTVQYLFRTNGLSTDNLQFTAYYSYAREDSGILHYYQGAAAYHLINSLPVFEPQYYWSFRDSIYLPGNHPPLPDPGSDTTTRQTLTALRGLFFKAYQSLIYSDKELIAMPRLRRPGYYYHDSCLVAQLGYLDASRQPNSNIPYNKKLLKVWKITSKGAIPYGAGPVTFVVDSTGDAWCTYPYVPGIPFPLPCPACLIED